MGRSRKKPLKPKAIKPKKAKKKSQQSQRARKGYRTPQKKLQQQAEILKLPDVRKHAQTWSDIENTLLGMLQSRSQIEIDMFAELTKPTNEKKDLDSIATIGRVLMTNGMTLLQVIAEAKKYGFWGTEEDNTEKILREERLKLFAKRNHKIETTDPYMQ